MHRGQEPDDRVHITCVTSLSGYRSPRGCCATQRSHARWHSISGTGKDLDRSGADFTSRTPPSLRRATVPRRKRHRRWVSKAARPRPDPATSRAVGLQVGQDGQDAAVVVAIPINRSAVASSGSSSGSGAATAPARPASAPAACRPGRAPRTPIARTPPWTNSATSWANTTGGRVSPGPMALR